MLRIRKLVENLTSSTTWLKVILVLQVLTGRYFRLSHSKYICAFIKLYCVFVCFVITFRFIFNHHFGVNLNTFVFSQYISNVVVNLLDSEDDFFTYCSNVRTTDRIMGFKHVPLFSNYMYILAIFIITCRFLLLILRFCMSLIKFTDIMNIFIELLAVDLSYLYICLIFSIVHCRMRFLRFHLENICVPVNVIGRSGVGSSVEKIRKSLYYYNNLLDSMQYIKKHLQFLCSVNYITSLFKLFFIVHRPAAIHVEGAFSIKSVLFATESIQTFFCLTYPSLIVEAIQYEVKKIRESLTNQLVRCSDGSLNFELETALHYVRLRPFSYSICRVVPLGASLPTSIICLCITYEIVAMQLTHASY